MHDGVIVMREKYMSPHVLAETLYRGMKRSRLKCGINLSRQFHVDAIVELKGRHREKLGKTDAQREISLM